MPQTRTHIDIDSLQIATPCHVPWDSMAGDDKTRFCGSCRKNVYRVAHMTRSEVSDLILEHEGHVCLQLYRRPDGTVQTADCRGGVIDSPRRRALKRRLAAALALATLLTGIGAAQAQDDKQHASSDPEVEAIRQRMLKDAEGRLDNPGDQKTNHRLEEIHRHDTILQVDHTEPPTDSNYREPQQIRDAVAEAAKREEQRAAEEEALRIAVIQQEIQTCDIKRVKPKKGDSIESIARAHDSKVDWILVANKGLKDDNLAAYGPIKVPTQAAQVHPIIAGGLMAVPPPPAPTPQAPAAD